MENMNELDNIIALKDEDGNDVEFEFLDLIEYDGTEYVVLLPMEESDEAYEVVILKLEEGENEDEVPTEMVKFLKFVKADLATCMDDFEDDFVSKLQKTMQEIKVSREMEGRYMSMALWLRDERKEGKEEGKLEERASALLDVLEEKGEVSEELEEKIFAEESMEVLRNWFKLAVKVSSVEEFVTLM